MEMLPVIAPPPADTILRHIMLVDDDAASREIGKLCLETRGKYKVTICRSGEEALEKIDACPPQLLLLDIIMPGIDGLMALNRIYRHHGMNAFPVVFITSRILPEQLRVYRNSGAFGVLPKPFDFATINSEIDAIWSMWINRQDEERHDQVLNDDPQFNGVDCEDGHGAV